MAIQYVYAVFDTAAQMYLNPMFFPSPGLAPRSFADEVNRAAEDNIIYRHPEDFELHLLCRFDTVTGLFTNAEGFTPDRPDRVARARDLVVKKD